MMKEEEAMMKFILNYYDVTEAESTWLQGGKTAPKITRKKRWEPNRRAKLFWSLLKRLLLPPGGCAGGMMVVFLEGPTTGFPRESGQFQDAGLREIIAVLEFSFT